MGSALDDNSIFCTRTLRHEGVCSWWDDLIGTAIDEPGGKLFHAGAPEASLSATSVTGRCVTAMSLTCFSGISAANTGRNLSCWT